MTHSDESLLNFVIHKFRQPQPQNNEVAPAPMPSLINILLVLTIVAVPFLLGFVTSIVTRELHHLLLRAGDVPEPEQVPEDEHHRLNEE